MPKTAVEVAKSLADAYNRKNWRAFSDLLHPDVVFEQPDMMSNSRERFEGRDAVLNFMTEWAEIVPDDVATFQSVRQVDNETVVCEVTWSGTHSGIPIELEGHAIPASYRRVTNYGSTTYVVRDSKILRIVDQWDAASYLKQFGFEE